jgi:hypothetical protein
MQSTECGAAIQDCKREEVLSKGPIFRYRSLCWPVSRSVSFMRIQMNVALWLRCNIQDAAELSDPEATGFVVHCHPFEKSQERIEPRW